MMTIFRCSALIGFLLQAATVFAADPVFIGGGSANVALALKDGRMFSAGVISRKPNLVAYGSPSLWGAEQGRPDSVIVKIDARINKKKIHIPFSAFADLANPANISLDLSNNDVILLVNGGDGADAYTAELVFQQGRYLKMRRVVNGSFPDKAWEETRYSFNIQ